MPPALAHLGFVGLWNPDIIVGLALALAGYGAVTGRWRPRDVPAVPWAKRFYFVLAVVSVYLAVGSPLDALSDRFLFSAHMLEHMILTMAAAPLILLGTPDWFWRPLWKWRGTRAVFRLLTGPAVAIFTFNIIFSILHFPGVYDLALRNESVHFAEHAVMLVTALLMWWPVLSPLPERPPLPEPIQLIYLFVDGALMIVVFALVTFATRPLYGFYDHAPRIIQGLTPLADQQVGGVIMKLATMVGYGAAFFVAFFRWARRERMMEEFHLLPRPGSELPEFGEDGAAPSEYRIWGPKGIYPHHEGR